MKSITQLLFISTTFVHLSEGSLPKAKKQSYTEGGHLTLNSCGKYPDFQKWSYDGKLLSLQKSGECIECSNEGYCKSGFQPALTYNCDSNNYMQGFAFSNNEIELTSQGTCIQTLGVSEYASIQLITCATSSSNSDSNSDSGIEYTTQDLQSFSFDSDSGYIESSINNSLCLTAAYYERPNCSVSPLNTYDYCNPKLDFETRLNDLISRMTLWEKIGNVASSNNGVPRLGVPSNQVLECLHGVYSVCGEPFKGSTGCPTSFPNPTLLGATFNWSLWYNIGMVVSEEGRALNNQNIGGLFCFSPNLNLFRDPRWGRGQEVPGEDPYLTSVYGIEYINGVQRGGGRDAESRKYVKMANTLKHYVDYDLEGCRYGIPCRTAFDANVTQQDQVEYYFPAMRSAIQGANVKSIMCSYNAINGVPACGNSLTMNSIGRDLWGFDGFIISDSGAIPDDAFTAYVKQQDTNGQDNPLLRTKIALEGGCDADLGDSTYVENINDAIAGGYITEDTLTTAVSRWLNITFQLGQMDIPHPWSNLGPKSVDTPENRELALSAAKQGIVLLQNNDSPSTLLPFDREDDLTYAFIGPHFNITQYMLSSYRGSNTIVNQHSPYQIAVEQGINVQYAMGCNNITCTNKDGFDEAKTLASNVDRVVLFMGLYAIQYAMPNQDYDVALEAEDFDRENIDWPGYQLDLIQEIYSTNENVVLVMFNSAQIDLTWPKENLAAIVQAFYPGEMGGDALISILFGDVSPAGRLPITLYDSSITQARDITDMSLSNNGGITYRYYQGTPLFPFGWGLSYTTFEYEYFTGSDRNRNRMETKTLADYYRKGKHFYREEGSGSEFIVQVTNTGKVDSDCVVLGFVNSTNPANETAPQIKLFGFDRVFVQAGKSVNVSLGVTAETISLTNKFGVERIVPGVYNIFLGDLPNHNFVKTEIELVGKEEVIFDLNEIEKKWKPTKQK